MSTLKDSASAVSSIEKGNIAFNDATMAAIILPACPITWRNQYEMNHKTIPESPRAMLQNLENIKEVFIEKYNKKAKDNKTMTATAPKANGRVPRKRATGGGSGGPAPKKGCTNKYCRHCQINGGPFTMHDTIECCKFNKDDKQKDKPAKPPFNSAKKPWKKGGGGSDQMAYLTEKMEKLKKKLKIDYRTKMLAKKCAHDLSESDSNSNYDCWSGSIGNHLDKRFKFDNKPSDIDLISTDTGPIQVTKLALNSTKTNEIAIGNSKTGKVTAADAIMDVFGSKNSSSRNASSKKMLNKPNKWLNLRKSI
jgi:hypothetical protein